MYSWSLKQKQTKMMVNENFLTGNVWFNDIWNIKQTIHLGIKILHHMAVSSIKGDSVYTLLRYILYTQC